jgi:hypothetical protein
MNAEQQNNGTKLRQYGWRAMERGASTPYVVIQPNMTDLFDNNNGQRSLDFNSVMGGSYNNELPILKQFIENAITALDIDTDRIHFHGFSRGAATANAFYCNPQEQALFASFIFSGGSISCDVNKSAMIINGNTDPNIKSADNVANNFLSKGNVSATTIAEESNWITPDIQLNYSFKLNVFGLKIPLPHPTLIGKQLHTRYIKDNVTLEIIKHSAVSLPLAGHCFPVKTDSGWLVCRSTFETGEKYIDFFINNPKSVKSTQ